MTEIAPIETSIKYLDDMAMASGHPVLVTEAIFNIRTTITALESERDALKSALRKIAYNNALALAALGFDACVDAEYQSLLEAGE